MKLNIKQFEIAYFFCRFIFSYFETNSKYNPYNSTQCKFTTANMYLSFNIKTSYICEGCDSRSEKCICSATVIISAVVLVASWHFVIANMKGYKYMFIRVDFIAPVPLFMGLLLYNGSTNFTSILSILYKVSFIFWVHFF